jgi:serine/threonine protein kinase
MIPCERDRSERFVAGLLNEAEESSFLEHLDICTICRQRLESATAGKVTWQAIGELLAPSYAAYARRQANIKTVPRSESALDDSIAAAEAALVYLAPTDDPAMMGRIGPYEIQGLLGRGGFGLVLKGHDRALDRIVAIKILDPALAGVGAARDRFAREARAMASISHEHVVPVYAVDTHAGLPYFVMEYVTGGALENRLRNDGRFDVVAIVRIGLQTAQALAAAHAQGLVHRDIKPGNILLDKGTERVRVADFGLARVANEVSSTKSGFIAGTPQYMSPEQVRGETCDGQSDLFSLGAVLYALCTGHAPFRADSVYGVMQRIANDPPRPIREQNPQIPDWLEQFVVRLLQKDKRRRFHSSQEVARLLQDELAYLQNPALTAKPQRRWSSRWFGRISAKSQRAAVVLFSLLIVVLAAALWLRPEKQTGSGNLSPDRIEQRVGDRGDEDRSAPLWHVDGTREVRTLADRLEAQWHMPTEDPTSDLWQQRMEYVRRLMKDATAEAALNP